MPKKISLAEKREWLGSYERGQSEASIAKDAHRDVRTVKRGIEQARRERDAYAARAELLKDALRKHQDGLLGVIDDILSAIVVPAYGIELWWERGSIPGPISLSAATASYESRQGWTVVLHAESLPLWELLQQHLRRDPMWNTLALWKKAVAAHLEARRRLKRKTAGVLEEKTRLKVIECPDTAPKVGLVYPVAVELFSQVAINRVLGIPDWTNPEERVMAMPDGCIEERPKGAPLAYAPDSLEECRENLLDALKELQKSSEALHIADTYRDAEEFTAKARKAVEEISLLGLVPGQCRVCRRLGI